jgi:hypothetical protein
MMARLMRLHIALSLSFAFLAGAGGLEACCPDCPPVGDAGVRDAAAQDASAADGSFVGARGPTNGSAVAMTADDTVGLFIARYDGAQQGRGRVALAKYTLDFSVRPPSMTSVGTLDDIGDAYQVLIAPDNDTAFIASSMGVLKLTGVHGQGMPALGPMNNDLGPEPRGLALSPSGKLLFAASWANGTVTVFNTADLSTRATVDLNRALAASGVLGPNLTGRPGLAHPFAIAVSDNGDASDDDETVYVTEFFSQGYGPGNPPLADDRNWDIGRQGVIYRFNVRTATTVGPLITLAPHLIDDAAFDDSLNFTTGCFPNQLSAATIHRGKLFVAGACASPRGPIGARVNPMTGEEEATSNFKSVVLTGIWVIDVGANQELPLDSFVVTQKFQEAYDRDQVPDDQHRRMPLLVNDIAFQPGTDDAYLTAYGADAVFKVSFDSDGVLKQVGAAPLYFIDLGAGMPRPGRLPLGIFIARSSHHALVVNEHSRNVSIIDLDAQNVSSNVDLAMPSAVGMEGRINDGRRDFVTGLDRWSFRGQAWSSCEACHPHGLSDGVTWFLESGPRQTPPLDASFSKNQMGAQRIFSWTANADEIHDFEMFTRRISGGVGAIVHGLSSPPVIADRIVFAGEHPVAPGQLAASERDDGINGSTLNLMPTGGSVVKSMLDEWDRIGAYVESIRPPHAPSNISPADAASGLLVFVQNNCVGCHVADLWTISRRFYTPSPPINDPDPMHGALAMASYMPMGSFPPQINPPSAADHSAHLRSAGAADGTINCVLRAVGTFPSQLGADQAGIAPAGVRVREVRDDMQTPALGAMGYNPPSVVGLAASAPYLHAGNARTLEELFTDAFAAHSGAYVMMGQFPGMGNRATLIHQLVAFLLSIDDTTAAETPPQMINGFAPLLCPLQFP